MPVFALHGIFTRSDAPEEAKAAEAMRARLADACAALGVPLHILDCVDIFLHQVIRPFVESYAAGQTPNPCALCNAGIKFGLLLQKARELGAAHLATGHYAQLVHAGSSEANTLAAAFASAKEPGTTTESVTESMGDYFPALLQGADSLKDQSYFLSLVPRENLASALFPLGTFHKKDVLETLARRGIAVPQPGESQEVCFVPGDEYRDFLPRTAKRLGISLPGAGPMLLCDGRKIGTHKGLWQYTEGQRRGLGIGWKEPLHVLAKEGDTNVLRLGTRAEMHVSGCLCDSVNMLLPPRFWPSTVYVKTRYRERPKPAQAEIQPALPGQSPALRLRFAEPDTAVAPGQIAAVYIPVPEPGPVFAAIPGASANPAAPPVLRLVAGGIITGVSV